MREYPPHSRCEILLPLQEERAKRCETPLLGTTLLLKAIRKQRKAAQSELNSASQDKFPHSSRRSHRRTPPAGMTPHHNNRSVVVAVGVVVRGTVRVAVAVIVGRGGVHGRVVVVAVVVPGRIGARGAVGDEDDGQLHERHAERRVLCCVLTGCSFCQAGGLCCYGAVRLK